MYNHCHVAGCTYRVIRSVAYADRIVYLTVKCEDISAIQIA